MASPAFYGIFDHVEDRIDNGVVVLTGSVTHEDKAARVVQLVSRVRGVQEVQNRITVLSSAQFDNRLRMELAKNIYGHELFWADATRVQPTVRIIVDNLNVQLAGVVVSEVEKQLAADIVRQTVGVRSLQNDLTVAGQA